eukprot:COSAG06_NODE_49608_length_324_cov_0.773333_2_plen_24_part_01
MILMIGRCVGRGIANTTRAITVGS